jgi:GNAT superfamily N-acetyltransferase
LPSPFPVKEISAGQATLIESAMAEEAFLVRPRFERGCRCFAVMVDGTIAGYGWLSTGPEWIGELQLEISPGPNEAYIWNCVTLAPHRQKGVFRSLLAGVSQTSRGEGVKRLWIGSVAIPAEKAVAASGFHPAMRFTSFGAVGMHFLRVSTAKESAPGAEAERVLPVKPGFYLRRSRRRKH